MPGPEPGIQGDGLEAPVLDHRVRPGDDVFY
jgi:hypothetical protein